MEDTPDTKKKRFQGPCHKESTPKEGNEDGVDHISGLPNDILGDIISLLPTMDGACTKCLSSTWSQLWFTAPLNFDYCDLQDPNDDKDLSPTLNGLQDLEFHIPEVDFTLSLYPPPSASIFRFSSTLRIVSFGGCRLPDIMVNKLQFPNFQQLALFDAIISEETLHAMLDSCPALEILLMKYHEGELIIEDAPLLERFIIFERYSRLHISVVSAPKLETLGCIFENNNKTKLTLGSMTFLEKLYIQLGTTEQLEFVTFFVENARMLESMSFWSQVVSTCDKKLDKKAAETAQAGQEAFQRSYIYFHRESMPPQYDTCFMGQ
ncbi:unnamed protein product [Miscanthus lutarioriparius]|uniref:Uncharacterized protein n=1 Tax=Miscanthus lutarioriparius TaxID=422564 RepID=A0A811NPZ7_9POAL|nr:unnamed protein product [Miscanthus lutarioriparius]